MSTAEKTRPADTRRDDATAPATVAVHGAERLTAVTVDACNSQLRDEDGFIGDRARRAAFFEALERGRGLWPGGALPMLGDTTLEAISKKQVDEMLQDGSPAEQALVVAAIEEYAGELATVIRRLLRTKDWRDTQRIAIGGGLREGRFAQIAVARAQMIARAADADIELTPIRNHPDEAGLIGAAHLAPSWMFASFDNILAVDIGGTNMRAGIVKLNLEKAPDLSRARVKEMELWRHADEEMKRDEAIGGLIAMLKGLIKHAEEENISLAPFIGVGCPGKILADGGIETGAQNLPGNWESSRFNLPHALWEAIPEIGGRETVVILHNDAVVQGLSEAPFMQDVEHWGVLTIGTGLGNARFTNRTPPKDSRKDKDSGKDKDSSKDKSGK
ncbi:ROK family protein [Ancylobacter sp. A5.8]|uniref:ROK family protein n=1 Tax=Ancylobacter gelatini TaxID=2919920 RepID=UPI001F4E67B3|nr:ROK family protein [Ancylobacter gelatini]MCJ8143441.1 ROK family protein [Ancylobacter gelatini]